MTGFKTLFFSSFIVFCSIVLSGSYLNNDGSNYGNLNHQVKNNQLNSHTNNLTQTTKNLETINKNIEDTNNQISDSQRELQQKELNKKNIETKIGKNTEKISNLTSSISKVEAIIKALNVTPGISEEKSKKIEDTKNLNRGLLELEEKIRTLLGPKNDKEENLGTIEKLLREFFKKQNAHEWYVNNRIKTHKKLNTQTAKKEKLESDKKTSEKNLQTAQNNLKTTEDLIKELEKELTTLKEGLKNFEQEQNNLTTKIQDISSQISSIGN